MAVGDYFRRVVALRQPHNILVLKVAIFTITGKETFTFFFKDIAMRNLKTVSLPPLSVVFNHYC